MAARKSELGVEAGEDYGSWINDVLGHVGNYVNLETRDGGQRGGRVTGVKSQGIYINGVRRELPVAVELNDDPGDAVELARIVKINFS